jgi:protein-S-isoprenylcysteine O-methyltransferase Ste14
MKKLLPPVLFVISLAAAWLANRFVPIGVLVPPAVRPFGCVLIVAGLALLVAARVEFARVRTNVYTFDEPGTLVTQGVFRLSRHPMYLGFALVLAGAAVWFGSIAAFVPAALFIAVTDRWYIAFEERWMRAKFGAAYEEYARRTRRWI